MRTETKWLFALVGFYLAVPGVVGAGEKSSDWSAKDMPRPPVVLSFLPGFPGTTASTMGRASMGLASMGEAAPSIQYVLCTVDDQMVLSPRRHCRATRELPVDTLLERYPVFVADIGDEMTRECKHVARSSRECLDKMITCPANLAAIRGEPPGTASVTVHRLCDQLHAMCAKKMYKCSSPERFQAIKRGDKEWDDRMRKWRIERQKKYCKEVNGMWIDNGDGVPICVR